MQEGFYLALTITVHFLFPQLKGSGRFRPSAIKTLRENKPYTHPILFRLIYHIVWVINKAVM